MHIFSGIETVELSEAGKVNWNRFNKMTWKTEKETCITKSVTLKRRKEKTIWMRLRRNIIPKTMRSWEGKLEQVQIN